MPGLISCTVVLAELSFIRSIAIPKFGCPGIPSSSHNWVLGAVSSSEWHGFQYPPGFGQRVCRVRGKGTASQTLTKPLPVMRVGG